MYHLFEQLYRTNRIYWHGSEHDFDNFKGQQIFLSTNKKFSILFVNVVNLHLYMCKLTKPLNLFNIAAKSDFKKVYDYLQEKEDIFAIEFKEMRDSMIKTPYKWRHWKDIEDEKLTETLIELEYDGFAVSEELTTDINSDKLCENIAVFNPNENIKILKHYQYKDIKDEVDAIVRANIQD